MNEVSLFHGGEEKEYINIYALIEFLIGNPITAFVINNSHLEFPHICYDKCFHQFLVFWTTNYSINDNR